MKNQGFWGSLFSKNSLVTVIYLLVSGAIFAGMMLGGHAWIYDYLERPPFGLFVVSAIVAGASFFGLLWVHSKIASGVADRYDDNKN